jgi:hypothetical protein
LARCAHTYADSSQCKRIVSDSETYCYSHDPERAQERKRNASKGGKRGGRGRPQAELANIKQRLSDLADGVLAEDPEERVDKGVAAVASQVLNVYLRAVSVELKAREQLGLVERLEVLEQALETRRGGSRWRGA